MSQLQLMPLETTEILRALRPGTSEPGAPAYNAAWGELYTLLRSLSTRCLGGDLATVRDDALDFVEEKVRSASPLDAILSHDPDAESDRVALNRRCEAYLRTMLENRAKSLLRRGSRTTYVDPTDSAHLDARAAQQSNNDTTDVEVERKYLARLFELTREKRSPRYRAAADVAWKQINELCFDGVTMADILERDEDVAKDASEADRARARDRVLQNHSRLRKEMRAELESLRTSRTWFALDADLADSALTRLFRRLAPANPQPRSRASATQE